MGVIGRATLLVLLLGALSVTADERLMIMPKATERSAFEGDNLYLSCFSNVTNVQRIMWTGPEGKQITAYNGRIHIEEGEGHKAVDLLFSKIKKRDSGDYTCSANVDGQEVSKTFHLFVYKKIDFLDTPKTQYLEEGLDSELECDITGDPKPSISWRFGGRKITYGNKYSKVSETSNNLIVHNVTLEDAGEYLCDAYQVSVHVSEVKDLKIDVKVHHKPLWNEDDKSKAYSYLSGSVNLTCEVEAEPEANFTWTKDDQVIYPSNTAEVFNENNTSILQLKVNQPDMFGDYLCKAQNKLGTLVRVIYLEEGEKPHVPTLKVTDKGVDSLHLSLDAKDHPKMPVVSFRVQYKEDGEDWSQAHTHIFQKGSEYILNNLKNDTPYVVRAAARNAAGFSDNSIEVTNRTDKIISSASTSASFSISSCVALLLFLLISASLL